MKITGITLYGLEVPLKEPVNLSRGRHFEGFDSTFVQLHTDEGIDGWSEMCPHGSNYLPAFAGGVRAGIMELAPHLIGLDPRQPDVINRIMDTELPGHPYVKAGIDYAIWDAYGKATGLPVYELLGGREEGPVPLSSAVPPDEPERMLEEVEFWRSQGIRFHSLKLGNGGPDADIARIRFFAERRQEGEVFNFDANGGWSVWEAVRVMHATADLDACFEQPCPTYEQFLSVRRRTTQALSMDETIVELRDLSRAIGDQACDMMNMKLGRVGGITRGRAIRDLAVSAGIPMLVMCMAGTVVNDTVGAHFAQSIPSKYRLGTWSCASLVTVDPAPGRGARNVDGTLPPPEVPGLGADPDIELLGEPIAQFRA